MSGIHEIIVLSECERYIPAQEPIVTVQACGDDIIMLSVGDMPTSGASGVENERSIAVRWADLLQAWEVVRDAQRRKHGIQANPDSGEVDVTSLVEAREAVQAREAVTA